MTKRAGANYNFKKPAERTMKIHITTFDKLAKFGEFGDTWEDIILRLMEK